MGCLLPLFALATPRFILVVLWLFTDYLSRAYENFWLPLLGFIFLPTTTVGYAIAQNMFDGVRSWGLVIVLFGLASGFLALAPRSGDVLGGVSRQLETVAQQVNAAARQGAARARAARQ